MFQSTSRLDQDNEFPPLGTHSDKANKVNHKWKISDPEVILPDGTTEQVLPTEAVLNWQSKNTMAQKAILKRTKQSQQRLEQKLTRCLDSLQTPLEMLKVYIMGFYY